MSIKESTRKKLHDAAKRNNFGGKVEKECICESCCKIFIGTPASKRCSECRESGYKLICIGCGNFFKSKYKTTKYCNFCCKIGIWNKKYDYSERTKKAMTTKRKWINSEIGKNFYEWIGKHNSKKMKEFNKTKKGKENIKNRAKKQSKIMKNKIKNGEFTPNITNSWTHWDANLLINNEIKKFRSSWEASFYMSNQNLLYETIRIPYLNIDNEEKTYIGDFYDDNKKILYEIKPKSVYKKQANKISNAINWCIKNGIKFVWINEDNILEYINKQDFNKYNIKQYNKMLVGVINENKN